MGVLDKIKDKLSSDKPSSSPSATTTSTAQPATSSTTTADPPTTSNIPSANMSTTTYTGVCHCKHHEWTVDLTPDQSKHILW
jgi:hypothetical protein